MGEPITIKAILDIYGLSYKKASELTRVPERTIQNWALGYREYTTYMPYLFEAAIQRSLREETTRRRFNAMIGENY